MRAAEHFILYGRFDVLTRGIREIPINRSGKALWLAWAAASGGGALNILAAGIACGLRA